MNNENQEFVLKMRGQAERIIDYWKSQENQDDWNGVQMADTLEIAKDIVRLCDIIENTNCCGQ